MVNIKNTLMTHAHAQLTQTLSLSQAVYGNIVNILYISQTIILHIRQA